MLTGAQGEDLATCAENAGFELPMGVVFGESVTPGTMFRASSAALNDLSLSTNASSSRAGAPKAVGSSSPHVQISVAREQHGTLFWMATGIGAVGLFMFSC